MKIALTPKKSLNSAYLKQKPLRTDIDRFKENLKKLIISINDTESEEFHKNLLSDFLKNTYYSPNHSINTKGRNDLVIHNGSSSSSTVGVLIEAKKPTNKAEMPSINNLNSKAMQELVLYYLRERITDNNLEVKHLIITNISEWFIFDSTVFEDLFAKNKSLVRQFKDFEEGRLSGTNTDYFYSNIAKPFIDNIEKDITFTHFLLDDYDAPLTNSDLKDDKKLIALYKLLSPEHLLKLPFANDSNTLNENFYKELLHLIGLTRVKDKGKELIDRQKEGERNPASLLENTITQLDDLDKLSRLDNPSQYGENRAERLFNVALELCITWVNRILFLKLLEAQLITYHKGNKDYEFLNSKKIKSFDDLNSLFFQVLAKLQNERNQDVRDTFAYVPYLNSSLFEPTEIEHNALFISNLKDDKQLPIITSTVLKDSNGKRITGTKSTLEYIFDFLNSYDFSSEGSEDIQEENKTLINASVLGLIFEKINGYKDGSFFTPGFITEYMCRETIRRAVIQKFNDELATTPSYGHPSIEREHTKNSPPLEGWTAKQGGVVDTTNEPYNEAGRGGSKIIRSYSKYSELPYNPKLKQRAKELRKAGVLSEVLMWNQLKKGQILGLDFDRQKIIGNYIVDFFNANLGLVIEIDGSSHDEKQEYDEHRQAFLEGLGLTVIRYQDREVKNNMDGIITNLKEVCKGLMDNITINQQSSNKGQVPPSDTRPPRPASTPPEEGNVSGFVSNSPPVGGVLNGVRRGGLRTLDDVYDIIDENGSITRQKANEIINSITICDPAVGSGHFLVSALNEILAIKNDLRILQDRDGRRLKEYNVSVVNDELIITDENNSLFEYNYQNKESQRVQEAIFHEKQTIIENCLFGVDINPNSVKICRLRLWIELLKHAYYKSENELETLPNIDINIKCGNSLISRFEIDADLKQALKSSKWNIQSYRNAVATYRNAKNKEEKREMERLINDIKNDFRTEINKNSKEMIRLFKLEKEQYEKFVAPQLFGHTLTPAQKKKLEEEHKTINTKIETLKAEIEEIKNNKIYINAFEWRFEFPEVLSEEGDFVGFDVVVGNPPYFSISNLKDQYVAFEKMAYFTFEKTTDVYCIFFEQGIRISKENGLLTYITSNKWMRAGYGKNLRHLFSQLDPQLLIDLGPEIFTNATVDTNLIMIKNRKVDEHNMLTYTITNHEEALDMSELEFSTMKELNSDSWVIMSKEERSIISKIEAVGKPLKDWDISINYGIKTGFNEAFIIDGTTKERLITEDAKSAEILKPILRGRDIKRYKANYANLWLIDSHNGYMKDGKRIERIHIEDYPAIKNHLDQYWEAIEKRSDKGETPYNLRHCAYHEDFVQEKIIYPETTQGAYFYIDSSDHYIIDKTGFIILGEKLEYLIGSLSSKLITYYYRNSSSGTKLSTKGFQYNKHALVEIFIKYPTPQQETQITDLVNQILAAKKEDPEADTQELEDEIDYLVYKLYDFTYDEVLIVDPDTKLTREGY